MTGAGPPAAPAPLASPQLGATLPAPPSASCRVASGSEGGGLQPAGPSREPAPHIYVIAKRAYDALVASMGASEAEAAEMDEEAGDEAAGGAAVEAGGGVPPPSWWQVGGDDGRRNLPYPAFHCLAMARLAWHALPAFSQLG